jgi:hypothetical protein
MDVQEIVQKRLRNLQKRLLKIQKTEETPVEKLNADQQELLSKKVVVVALIAELTEQLSLLSTYQKTQLESLETKEKVLESKHAEQIKLLETQHVQAIDEVNTTFYKSITALANELLTAKNLSDRHFTLLQSIRTLLSSPSNSMETAAQLKVLIDTPMQTVQEEEQVLNEKEEKKNDLHLSQVDQDSHETLGVGSSFAAFVKVPCFMSASEVLLDQETLDNQSQFQSFNQQDSFTLAKQENVKEKSKRKKGKSFKPKQHKEINPVYVDALNEAIIPSDPIQNVKPVKARVQKARVEQEQQEQRPKKVLNFVVGKTGGVQKKDIIV